MSDYIVEMKHITKRFPGIVANDDVSIGIKKGEIFALLGENGAGKSTLLKILATIEQPSAGKIQFNKINYHNGRSEVRKQIGFVPQDIAVWEDFTVEENMLFFEKLSWKKKDKGQLRQLCLDMKLDRWKDKVKTLSGGMKRKLNMAISLIHDPDILLLDEPTVGIDLKSRTEIGTYLREQAIKNNKIIIYTSHDMDEIINLCDRVICIGKDPFYQNILAGSVKEIITFD